ncbi:hypothetical protein H4582DRAFT_1934041, partial [Lactarius indigo]
NGLVTRFPTFGSLPSFPGIGAAEAVGHWNSTLCGSCWELTFEAMNILTNGKAQQLGAVNAQSKHVANSFCGLT